jgi:hypothetical protein
MLTLSCNLHPLRGLEGGGWRPPVRLFRRLSFRTHSEIDMECCALRFLRGDFNDLSGLSRGGTEARAEKAFQLAEW